MCLTSQDSHFCAVHNLFYHRDLFCVILNDIYIESLHVSIAQAKPHTHTPTNTHGLALVVDSPIRLCRHNCVCVWNSVRG